jgi:hypothetical protein
MAGEIASTTRWQRSAARSYLEHGDAEEVEVGGLDPRRQLLEQVLGKEGQVRVSASRNTDINASGTPSVVNNTARCRRHSQAHTHLVDLSALVVYSSSRSSLVPSHLPHREVRDAVQHHNAGTHHDSHDSFSLALRRCKPENTRSEDRPVRAPHPDLLVVHKVLAMLHHYHTLRLRRFGGLCSTNRVGIQRSGDPLLSDTHQARPSDSWNRGLHGRCTREHDGRPSSGDRAIEQPTIKESLAQLPLRVLLLGMIGHLHHHRRITRNPLDPSKPLFAQFWHRFAAVWFSCLRSLHIR